MMKFLPAVHRPYLQLSADFSDFGRNSPKGEKAPYLIKRMSWKKCETGSRLAAGFDGVGFDGQRWVSDVQRFCSIIPGRAAMVGL